MKNSNPSPNPRFVCQLVRTWRAVNNRAGGGHVSACADCQAYERAAAELDSELRREASAARVSGPAPSSDLARSIHQAIREERAAGSSAPALARTKFPLWASGALAAAAAVALAVYFQRPSNFRGNVATAEDAVAVMDAVENFSVKMKDTVIPATVTMVANNPLQRELGSVYSDARAALNFLALNFLPTASVPETPVTRI